MVAPNKVLRECTATIVSTLCGTSSNVVVDWYMLYQIVSSFTKPMQLNNNKYDVVQWE